MQGTVEDFTYESDNKISSDPESDISEEVITELDFIELFGDSDSDSKDLFCVS